MNPGDKLGRYVLERLLGRGAVGEVFQAVDPLIGRKVALKTLRTDLDEKYADEFRERFLREAVAAGRLSHPNITTLYDVGEDPATGVAFIAMEFVEGTTLETLAAPEHQVPLEQAVELGATLADALGYAHGEGVVHRDIKPANILVTPSGKPKITDFGIARLDASTLTVQGALLGTPYYMSPEQVHGAKADGRTDLYALGIILFELLTGTRPYAGRSLMTMLRAIITEEPADLTTIRTDIPGELSAVVLRALAKDPTERYQTGAELATALRTVNLSPPAVAPEPDPFAVDHDAGATVIGVSLAAMAELSGTIEFSSGQRRIHLRSKAEVVLGRDPSADIHVADQKVSRRHGILSLTDTGLRYTDLSSSNGSTVNGNPVDRPVDLNDGDVLGVGAAAHFLVRFRRRRHPPLSAALIVGGHEYLLNRGEITLGSDPQATDIRIPDPDVGRVHARLVGTLMGAEISCLDPAQPVIVDSQPTRRGTLTDGSTFEIGSTRLVWSRGGPDPPSPGPTRF